MGKSSSNPPPAPDYKGAAEATTKSQQVSQYTPYGSLVYGSDPSSPSGYKSSVNLAPSAQSTLDQQMALSGGLAGLANQYMPFAQEQYSQPMDMSSVGDIADQSYAAQTSRLDPQWQQREEMERTRLQNQGIGAGSEAYANQMRDFNYGRNDAYQQARQAAIQTMPQTYQLASATYNQPLNTLNALRSGAQVQNPSFGSAPGTDYMGAAKAGGQYAGDVYNAQVGSQNAMTSGLYGLAGAMLPLLFSDRRLKRDIEQIGQHPAGVPLYRFRYIWDTVDQERIGVMADEVQKVRPEAVTERDGYLMVDYAKLYQ